MIFLLRGLLYDLHQRCGRLKQEIKVIDSIPDEISDYCNGIINSLEKIELEIKEIQEDPDLELESLSRNFLHKYKLLAEQIHVMEWRPILAISRYSSRDRLSTLICQKIAEEIKYPWVFPICTALSSQHYWADPGINMIMLPAIEPFHLLGLPDLYHELAHIVLFRKKLIYSFYSNIDKYFGQESEPVKKEEKPAEYSDIGTKGARQRRPLYVSVIFHLYRID